MKFSAVLMLRTYSCPLTRIHEGSYFQSRQSVRKKTRAVMSPRISFTASSDFRVHEELVSQNRVDR